MGEPKSPSQDQLHQTASSSSRVPPLPPPLPSQPSSLLQPSQNRKSRSKALRVFRSVFRSFPIITPACRMPSLPMGRMDSSKTEMGSGMVRIALECEKRADKDKTSLLDEPMWTMYCNGKKSGYAVKREAAEEDLSVMELLKAVTMGAAVLPGKSEVEGPDGEMVYMRALFERLVGSKDSATLYMLSPEGNNGPELSIFFVRI
ncbi:PREDICTED: protein MIZU-KUSSEI 1-like [Prunus mume]|uniref:Protein MIZU-KUSSEI 1-like n=1 Tax=Prunus mume TaxID=102107 RepID=A0ABM1LYN0_PRUMU|nr:PREDICTED: protein MIZU-KUSSEI 1-like [Prunus mume]